ncbi:MAG: hypothetical protein IPM42_19810 [Saprospiraceae bacterium]|nr:hypothetical protein [Saprospiraceae bacterium]
MYKLEFTLKQHTPIIHFQHDQDGATLRATEVKPKLDRFILEKMRLKNETIPDSWFNNKEKGSLDYKLKIDVSGNKFCEHAKYTETNDGKYRPNFPCVFGNVKSEEEWKYLLSRENTCLTFFCTEEKLNDKIKSILNHFFITNTFGFRQSKGFGSFYLSENDKSYISPTEKYHFSVDVSKAKSEMEKYEQLFKTIDLFYKTLRSGINLKDKYRNDIFYFKSLMFMYAKSPSFNQQWDKRTIREHFYSNHETYKNVKIKRISEKDGTVNYSSGNKDNLLFRDLMGLSTEQDWMNYGKQKKDKDGNPILKNGNNTFYPDMISKSSANEDIDRFKSPITFKPIKRKEINIYDVYIVTNEIHQKYLGHNLIVNSKSSNSGSLNMSIPKNFSIEEYLNFCFKTIFPSDMEFDAHVSNHNNIDAKILKSIFNELRNN